MGEYENRLLATVTPLFFKGMTDCVAKMLVEYWWLQKHGCFQFGKSGKVFQWRARLRRGTPIGYTGVEGHNFAVRNDYEVAELPWRGIADGLVITWQETKQIKGKEAIFPIMKQYLSDLSADLLDRFGTDFYGDGTSLNSRTFHGLAASVKSTGTYAGLSMTTNTNWAANVVDGTGFGSNPMKKLLMAKTKAAKGEKGGRQRNKISIFLGTETDYHTICDYNEGKQRFVSDEEMLKAGFEDNIKVHGVPFAWSEYATANKIWGLNHQLFEVLATTDELFEDFNEWTVGLPKVFLGIGVSNFNVANKNPRGSVVIENTDL